MKFKPWRSFAIGVLVGLIVHAVTYAQAPEARYDQQWKRVTELIKKDLPRSALAAVRAIYKEAKTGGHDAERIKALVYMMTLENEFTENSELKSIPDTEKEMVGAKEPAKSILHSLLAKLYWNYYQQHRFQLYQRTNTQSFKKDDIATWTADDFHKKIGDHYLQSIRSSSLLKQVRLEAYDPIIVKGNVRHLRPTLFDLLAHEALDYFKNDERDLSRPAYAFEITTPEAFDPADQFVHHTFTTRDSSSLQFTALLLYQQLISFHLNDAKPDALLDVDLERIEFVNETGVQERKEELYLAALRNITKKFGNLPAASQAWYLIARQFDEDASNYQPFGDTTHRFDKVTAKEICERVVIQKDSSEGKINCFNLLNELTSKEISFKIEKVNIPGRPFRALFEFKNVSTVYLRLVKADEKWETELENHIENFRETIVAAPPARSWSQELPETGDLQEHSVEVKIDAVAAGDYFLVASTDKNFSLQTSPIAAKKFYVSHISFIRNKREYFLLDRETGHPLPHALVTVWGERYDSKTSRYLKLKLNEYSTDDKGFFRLQARSQQGDIGSFLIDIVYNGERLFMDDAEQSDFRYDQMMPEKSEDRISVFLFTDRSIYRPGQTLLFKGIAVATDRQSNKLLIKQGYQTIIYLRDANNEPVDSMTVITNDYGSFSGKFRLPQSGLNGAFTLSMKDGTGSSNISVEEYKRPKFQVELEKPKGGYKANDTVKVVGSAKAYAGNNIDNGAVKYRVVRRARFIYDWLWWRPPTEMQEIAHGEIKTDKTGKFEITFRAIPDIKVDRKFDPVFDFTVYADVTDNSGETRSAQSIVSAGYKAITLTINLPEKLPTDSFRNISLLTANLAGEFVPANVSLKIYKLAEEKRLIRSRYWQRPDQFVITRQDYLKWFPNDEYDNETDPRSWGKEKQIVEITDSSKENGKWQLIGGVFDPGFYEVEVTAVGPDGQESKDVKYLELYDKKSDKRSHPQYLWTEDSKPIEPGEATTIRIGTSATDVHLISQLTKSTDGSHPPGQEYSFVRLNNETKTFEFAANENDRGGFGATYFFVKNNRFYEYTDVIDVPWTNKELKIEYATFRDKTLPGSEEKWKVKITGSKSEKVTAEVLASMYDASLDQFKPHGWEQPPLWPTIVYDSRWDDRYDFLDFAAERDEPNTYTVRNVIKNYEMLINPGYMMRVSGLLAGKVSGMGLARMNEKAVHYLRAPTDLGKSVTFQKTEEHGDLDSVSITQHPNHENAAVQIRKNFDETAFFFPDLYTDSTGAIEFSFAMPEALTTWKLQMLAHTKDLAFGISSRDVITQKQLMVQPNTPRFLRQGDRIDVSAKIVNLTDSEFTGQVQLQLVDATTGESVDGWFQNMFPNQYFTVAARQSEAVKFPIQVPFLFNKPLAWRIIARAGSLSDGEEDAIPVLTNKVMVTETLPLNMREAGTKTFKLENLLNSGSSETRQSYKLTVEYSGNPVWYAVQALPYLIEFPYECAEQTWNRYYANSLATMIVNSSSRVKEIFSRWADTSGTAVESALQKNQELKSALLEETPWVLDAKTEEEQMKNITLLFDLAKMSSELKGAIGKLKQMQLANGGFPWFSGGPDDPYITQYIITGIGHLRKLKAITAGHEEEIESIVRSAMPYLDKRIKDAYDKLLKSKTDLKKYAPSQLEIQYLYMRSFFPEYSVPKNAQTSYQYFRKQSQLSWAHQDKYMQGMIALSLSRSGDSQTPVQILKSLKETAEVSEELGMFWKNEPAGWSWYQAPMETQALLIEAFAEIAKDNKTVEDLKIWLLKNKQTNNWRTTKATAEACYALLLQGSSWLSNQSRLQVKLGNTTFSNDTSIAGTGYFKRTLEGELITPEMGNITVTLATGNVPRQGNLGGWGAVYWQYFEDLDKVISPTAGNTVAIRLSKKLFVEKNTDTGPVLIPINEGSELHVGDKLKVRIELHADRDMEYVHMKDLRASCLEPVNVLSGYKWQDGLGYYETTKDASSNFFFDHLRKGTYVFEYSLFATHTGNFSNGITTVQCMYAPEFSSHSEGVRISVAGLELRP